MQRSFRPVPTPGSARSICHTEATAHTLGRAIILERLLLDDPGERLCVSAARQRVHFCREDAIDGLATATVQPAGKTYRPTAICRRLRSALQSLLLRSGPVGDGHSHQRRTGVRLRQVIVCVEVVSRRMRAFGIVG